MRTLVSAIMPTANRRHLLPLALASFLGQDWPNKELIVIDDGCDPVEDICGDQHGVRYFFTHPARTIGAKLNHACEVARGDVLIRFDDDDWSAPGRITDQVNRLLDSRKSVTGYHGMLFWETVKQRAFKFPGNFGWSCGTALCFLRSYWDTMHFLNTNVCEDIKFIEYARLRNHAITVDAGKMMVARIHGQNTIDNYPRQPWPEVPRSEVPEEFFSMLAACSQALPGPLPTVPHGPQSRTTEAHS